MRRIVFLPTKMIWFVGTERSSLSSGKNGRSGDGWTKRRYFGMYHTSRNAVHYMNVVLFKKSFSKFNARQSCLSKNCSFFYRILPTVLLLPSRKWSDCFFLNYICRNITNVLSVHLSPISFIPPPLTFKLLATRLLRICQHWRTLWPSCHLGSLKFSEKI